MQTASLLCVQLGIFGLLAYFYGRIQLRVRYRQHKLKRVRVAMWLIRVFAICLVPVAEITVAAQIIAVLWPEPALELAELALVLTVVLLVVIAYPFYVVIRENILSVRYIQCNPQLKTYLDLYYGYQGLAEAWMTVKNDGFLRNFSVGPVKTTLTVWSIMTGVLVFRFAVYLVAARKTEFRIDPWKG